MYQGFTVLNEIALFAYFLPLTKKQVFRKSIKNVLQLKCLRGWGFSPYLWNFLPLTKNQVFSKTVSKALCIKSFPVIDHSPYFLTFSPLTKNQVFRKNIIKALCINGFRVWNFTGGWIFFCSSFIRHFLSFINNLLKSLMY